MSVGEPAISQAPMANPPLPHHGHSPNEDDQSGAGAPALATERIAIGRPGPIFEARPPDPTHRLVPFRPDTTLDGWSNKHLAVRGASIRGEQHRFDGSPRQDDFALLLRKDGKQLIVAVADGVSAAPQSHLGSSIVVRYAVQWLDAKLSEETQEPNWQDLVESAAWALAEQAVILFGVESTASEVEQLVATTLVCAVIDSSEDGSARAQIVSVGDSGAWVLSRGKYTQVAGGKCGSDDGLTNSGVSGLPRIPEDIRATGVEIEPGGILLIGTDGFGDPLGDGGGDVGRMFSALLEPHPPAIVDFARAVDFSRETFDDDRTLVAVWPLDSRAVAGL